MFLVFQAKYNVACHEKDEIRDQNRKLESQISDLKENMNRCVASNKIEVRIPRWCWIAEKESALIEAALCARLPRAGGGAPGGGDLRH